MYFQNAAPNGLTQWVLVEECLRLFKYLDNQTWCRDLWPGLVGMNNVLQQAAWEQDLFTFLVGSAMRGLPWLPPHRLANDFTNPARRFNWPEPKHRHEVKEFPLPEDWADAMGRRKSEHC